ncbi:MAG: HAD family hydrolase [Coriobacteriales bacterium]
MDKVRIAAFDLDGTVLDGESPFILTRRLLLHHDMKIRTGLRMGVWGIKYRMRLPQRESTPRELLFSAFAGMPVEEVDAHILRVYNKHIAKRVRPGARAEVASVKEQGMVPILASASFKPMTDAVVEELGFEGQVSTVMEERNGVYTSRVVGEPVQGVEKLRQLQGYCDGRFGVGNWVLERAYSDHYSDIPMLQAAQHAVVTDPDGVLKKVARVHGWEVVDWDAPGKQYKGKAAKRAARAERKRARLDVKGSSDGA